MIFNPSHLETILLILMDHSTPLAQPDGSEAQDTLTFYYEPLDPGAIRLLEISPLTQSKNGRPTLTLRQGRPGEPYRCLSYMWGDQTERFEVHVNQMPFFVGRNLYDFLHHIACQPEVALPLWIDAICINQSDNGEKSIQVQRMGDIYAEGEETIIWLGPGTESSDRAMELVSTLSWRIDPHLPPVDPIGCLEDWATEAVDDVVNLLLHPYWNRAWIAQEIILSRRLVLWTCNNTLNGDAVLKLTKTITLCFGVPVLLEANRKMYPILRRLILTIGFKVLWPRTKLITPNVSGHRFSTTCFHEYPNLYSRECSDARDRIFSILALVEPELAVQVQADYSKSASEVFKMVWKAEEKHLRPQRPDGSWDPVVAEHRWSFADALLTALELSDDQETVMLVDSAYSDMRNGQTMSTSRLKT